MPELTELTDVEAERVDGVRNPANGFPILMIKALGEPEPAEKAVNAQGGIDEKPDIASAERVLVELFKLIGAEAAEGATGAFHELYDIQMLVEAVCLMRCFLQCERDGDVDDGEPIAKALDYVIKRKFSAQQRRELASKGHALEDGSYPIENAEDLHNAATLARSGHGNVAAAKRLIAKRAKELGVANPLANDATKEAEAVEPEVTETETPTPDEVEKETPDTEALIKEAVAKAVEPLEKRAEALEAELAKVKATPLPGGPAVTAPAGTRAESQRVELLKEAAYYDRMADLSAEQDMKVHYRAKADAAKTAAGV